MEPQNIFDLIDSTTTADAGRTVHSNTHCNALVENPFAWDDEHEDEAEA